MDYPLNPRFFVCHPVGKDIMTAVCACSYEIRNRVTLEDSANILFCCVKREVVREI